MNKKVQDTVIIETERLVIREVAVDDAEFILELMNTPSFMKFIGDRCIRTICDARSIIDGRYQQCYRRDGYGPFAVVLRAEGKPIGVCGFVQAETRPGPNMGFAFLPQYEGKGYGYESSAALLRYGRMVLKFSEVYAMTRLRNARAIRLLTSLGFSFRELISTPDGKTMRLFCYAFASAEAPKPDIA